ncbi:MAG: ATP-binding protein [Nitrospiraceae bacterium]|nr:ATP-binding protein [Nitrospiraceae bacterium]
MMPEKLKPDQLYKCCDPEILDFKTTKDISSLVGTIGQERAMHALDFGLNFSDTGFNIFVLGETGTGKLTTIKMLLKEKAAGQPVPPDWCYVYNFKDPDIPKTISLEAGKAQEFHRDMEEFIKNVKTEIPKVFESKEYEKQRSKVMEDFQKRQKDLFSSLESQAQENGFTIKRTVAGLVTVPVKKNGEPLTEEEFEALDEKTKKKIELIGKDLQEKLDDIVRNVRAEEKSLKEELNRIERQGALSAIGHMIEDLRAKYGKYEKINDYLTDVQEDILEHLEDFKPQSEEQPAAALPFMRPQRPEPSFVRYVVNVLVNNSDVKGAPCVFESNPTYNNLFGRLEYKFQFGVATTDFSMIKSGALHKANGGYLIVDAMDLLRNIFSYEALKRAVRNRELKLEDVWEQYRAITTAMLRPESIPLNLKVILVGNPQIYYLLYSLDEEYREIFKVKADFDSFMDRTPEHMKKYVSFVALKCEQENLLPFDASGIAKIIEYSSRLAGHQDKITTRFRDVTDLVRESHYWANNAGSGVVTAEHVEKALYEKIYRHSRISDRIRDLMIEDTLIVETAGATVGQINGLAVMDMGDYSFGKPSRITARTYAGKAGVVNIERETKMSGKIHEKAVLIITNYLWSKYAAKKPISISASLTFEQLYEMIEGDSASCAELYTILSSAAGVPIKQSFAVTGSMDQNGDVQPIGGVNEKIEGFFEICKIRGLDGSQGVIIPKRNIKNLMLKKEVVDAVRDGKFSIYPISHAEDAIELLMGIPAGEPDGSGKYPEGTLNFLVSKRLDEIGEAIKSKKDEGLAEAVHEEPKVREEPKK